MSDIITVRDVEIITTEIKTIRKNLEQFAIYSYIEIGRRLTEAKEIVGHGGWGKYLEESVEYSQQQATNLMNLYKEYGNPQESMFPSFANSQSFGNIDVTKHILLLAVPSEERAAFAEEHDAENSTVKQLQAAIKERDASREEVNHQTARAEKAEAKAVEMGVKVSEVTAQLDAASDKLLERETQIKQLQEKAEKAEKDRVAASGKVDKLKAQLAKAQEGEKTAKEALQKAKEHPEIPEAMMEEMRQQVAADAAEQATAEIKKQLEAAQTAADEAESRRKEAEGKLAEAEKKARAADGNIALVKAYSEGLQEQFNKLVGAIKLVENVDPERGASLRKNAREKVLPALMKMLEG